MPTGTERLIWGQGSPSTLRAVTTTIRGVKLTLAAAICWENYMPLLRQSLYSQNVNLYLAPTADPRDTWAPLMRTIACEGRTFVLSANQAVQRKHLQSWIRGIPQSAATHHSTHHSSGAVDGAPLRRRRTSTITKLEDGHEVCLPCLNEGGDEMNPLKARSAEVNGSSQPAIAESPQRDTPSPSGGHRSYFSKAGTTEHRTSSSDAKDAPLPPGEDEEEFLSRGGSCIISPLGEVLAGPLWEQVDAAPLIVEVDFDDCDRGRLDFDAAGHYSRNDAFKLTVEGLDLNPPP